MASIWNGFRGHGGQVDMFQRAIARDRLAQGYLFIGPAGVGKRTFAKNLATCLFCERHDESDLNACGECPVCRQMAAGSHPDYFEVGCPEGKRELPISVFLGEDDERGRAGLCFQLSLSPTAGGRRIAVIDDADTMNDAAANAFLKTLEEPPPGTLLILIAERPDELLPTIRSRCQLVRFASLSESDVEELLVSTNLVSDVNLATVAAHGSDGSLEIASRLADPALNSLRQIVGEELAKTAFDPASAAERLIKGIEPFSDLAAQREATGWIARFAADYFQSAAREIVGSPSEDATGIALANRLLELGGCDSEAIERVNTLFERASAVEDQLGLYASPVLCIESFTYGIASQLRN